MTNLVLASDALRPRDKHKTKQDYQTPIALLEAVRERFGPLDWDLAATEENAVALDYITPEQDSLKTPWPGFDLHDRRRGPGGPVNLWLNPPFADIAPWAFKCVDWLSRPAHPASRLFFLVPASVGSNWWTNYVSEHARVSPRLKFGGCKDPFPKDCALCVYEHAWPVQPCTVTPWRWDYKNESLRINVEVIGDFKEDSAAQGPCKAIEVSS